jgi:hypothetical protein
LATTLTEMKAWREDQRSVHRQRTMHGPVARGTLAADIERYLKLVATMPSLKDRARDLDAWFDVLGTKGRSRITRDDVRLALQTWRLQGGADGQPLSASTCNHRRTALLHVYTVLDGKGAPNRSATCRRSQSRLQSRGR